MDYGMNEMQKGRDGNAAEWWRKNPDQKIILLFQGKMTLFLRRKIRFWAKVCAGIPFFRTGPKEYRG